MTESVPLPAPPLGADELDALQAAYRRELLGRFAPESLLWLAALPEWPQALAEQCRFPTAAAGSLPDLVRQLVGAGLAEQRESIEASGELVRTFWVSPSRRPELGGYLRQTLTHEELLEGVNKVWAAVGSAVAGAPGRWPQAETWQQVSVLRLDPTGSQLNDTVDSMLGRGLTEHAMAVIGAAQAIGDVIGEPLVSAARRAGWRLDRAYRQGVDLRMLADYLPRPQLERMLEALIDGQTPVVHLLGDAGVGKTMLVRSLASGEYARRYGRDEFPVARIDFDYLDPRYPETRPAELLLALAADLTGYSASRTQQRHLRLFEDAAAALHESLASERVPRGLPHSGTSGVDPALLHRAIDTFADYLDELAEKSRPVVLILDTCEELAKLHAPGAPAPALERTFQIIERIRQRSAVRVLLAGRRPLVQTGTAGSSGDVDLRPRDYVTVVPVGGFALAEAIEYIDRRDSHRLVSPELRDAVLSRCLREGTDKSQVNPFDLAGYLDWALDEPSLDPKSLAFASGDPYVEQRILGRIRDAAVRDALPVAVQLGRSTSR